MKNSPSPFLSRAMASEGGERGITCGDPFWGTLQSQTNPYGFLFIFLQALLKASIQRAFSKTNNPADAGFVWPCGERGIRTPGTVSHTAV